MSKNAKDYSTSRKNGYGLLSTGGQLLAIRTQVMVGRHCANAAMDVFHWRYLPGMVISL